jgi:hypothetical protein
MNKNFFSILTIATIVLFFSSCSSTRTSMREPNTRVNFNKVDFTLSEQVSAEASTTRILMIDFKRIFKKETGDIVGGPASLIPIIPVIGGFVADRTQGYALHKLMKNNQGYDVVFYPQYETKVKRPILGLGLIFNKITVKATARLGKLN